MVCSVVYYVYEKKKIHSGFTKINPHTQYFGHSKKFIHVPFKWSNRSIHISKISSNLLLLIIIFCRVEVKLFNYFNIYNNFYLNFELTTFRTKSIFLIFQIYYLAANQILYFKLVCQLGTVAELIAFEGHLFFH